MRWIHQSVLLQPTFSQPITKNRDRLQNTKGLFLCPTMTSRSPVMHTKGNQEMDFKSVRVVGDESNFHERLFFEAWMSIKDPQSGNHHIVIPSLQQALKSRSTFSWNFTWNFLSARSTRRIFYSRLLALISTDEGSSSSRNVLNETSKRVRRVLNQLSYNSSVVVSLQSRRFYVLD